MSAPRVSVIIPVYNAEKYLKRCIDSIQAQTFTDYEALFVDDRSSDRSREIIKEFQANDTRIKLIGLEANGGSGVARNIGIENARGEYLSFIDADDAVSPDFLKLLYEKAEETGADVVKGSFVYPSVGGGEDADTAAPHAAKAHYDRGDKLYNVFVKGHVSAIYRRGFIEAHSIRYGATRMSHDVVFLLQVGYFADSFEIAPNAEYRYFDNEGSAVHTFSYERFVHSLLAVGEVVDFINENDSFSDELAKFLLSFLKRQLPAHSYMCTQAELADKAPAFLEELRGVLKRFKNTNALAALDYAVRTLIEFNGKANISPRGVIVGLKNSAPWRLFAFEKLVEHINGECADKAAAMDYLCLSLASVEGYIKCDDEDLCPEEMQEFCEKLHGILLKLNDREAFIERGGSAAKAMLEYGVNLFYLKVHDPLADTEIRLEILKRTLDLIERHPEALNDHMSNAENHAEKLMLRFSKKGVYDCEKSAKLIFELYKQIKRVNALERSCGGQG